jgi:hypothetical protein
MTGSDSGNMIRNLAGENSEDAAHGQKQDAGVADNSGNR